jgi:signal transduction histidine kinase
MWSRTIGRIVFNVSTDPVTTPTLAGLRQARAQQAEVLRWFGLFVPILLVLVLVPAFHTNPEPGTAGRGLVVSICLAGFLFGALGMRATITPSGRLRSRLLGSSLFGSSLFGSSAAYFAFLALLFASTVTLLWVQPKGPGVSGLFICILFFARKVPGRVGILLSVAAFVVVAAVAVTAGQGASTSLIVVVVFGGFYVMSRLAVRLGEANAQAEALLVELEQSRTAEARAAVLAERQRLAREMHDVLAHSLSGLLLQLEGARMLAAEDPNDPRLPQAIERAHHLGQAGLEEARRAIGMLRDDELPGPDRLAELMAQFEQDRDIPCRLVISGETHQLDPEARLALYRVAQEALTNITKHAHPERVELRLAYLPDATRLTIEDFTTASGTSPDQHGNDFGYGLTGMRERAELLGGTLTTEATGNGFRVELDVPT